MSMNTEEKWVTAIAKQLVGRTIVKVRYLTKKEMDELGWYDRSVVLHLDDGNIIFPSADDEGNNAGSLFTNSDDLPVIPVMR